MVETNGTISTDGILEFVAEDIPTHKMEVVDIPINEEMISVQKTKVAEQKHLISALAESINTLGLLNPILVLRKDDGTYLLVSGYQRLQACRKIGWETIPAHITSFEGVLNKKKASKGINLSRLEENLLRKQLLTYDISEHLGQCKELYNSIHQAEIHSHGGNRSEQDLTMRSCPAYIDKAAEFLGKSRATAGKYLQIYENLIKKYPKLCKKLRDATLSITGKERKGHTGLHHPILNNAKELISLSNEKGGIPELIDLMTTQVNTRFTSLSEAKSQLQNKREKERRKREEEEKSKGAEVQGNDSGGGNPNPNPNSNGGQDDENPLNPEEQPQGSENNGAPSSQSSTKSKICSYPYEQLLSIEQDILGLLFEQNFLVNGEKGYIEVETTFINMNSGKSKLAITVAFKGFEVPEGVDKPPADCHGFGLFYDSCSWCKSCPIQQQCIDTFNKWLNNRS